MKLLLFDQNLSPRLVSCLADIYPGSVHLDGIGLATTPDREVWDYARQHDYIIVTKDADVVLCDLNPLVATEQAGIRPVVILQYAIMS
ncbi:DUF5615 family PIN-like protein [Microcoleus sp. ARI1-B5]|uniref:DUF5615 family PIN-like protein n=1 Tax=unclassified Microcoleus TaxID=2642155 RepID=UPI002FD5A3B5